MLKQPRVDTLLVEDMLAMDQPAGRLSLRECAKADDARVFAQLQLFKCVDREEGGVLIDRVPATTPFNVKWSLEK